MIGVVVFSFILRLLWLQTTIEGDEGYSAYAAWLWNLGYKPFSNIIITKGLLLSFLERIPISVFGNTIIPIRLMNDVLFLLSIVVLYLFVKDWFGRKVGLISALFYGVFMNAPAFEAQMVMVESASIPFVIFSIYFCNKFLKSKRRIALFISGFMASAAFFIMQSQFIIIVFLLIMLIFSRDPSKRSLETRLHFVKGLVINMLSLVAGAILLFAVFFIYFWNQGILSSFIRNYFLFYLPGNLYLSTANALSGIQLFGIQFLTIFEGLPLWLFAIFGAIVCLYQKKYYAKSGIFALTLTLLLFLAASIPPNFSHHYAILIAPASILASVAVCSISTFPKGNTKNIAGVLLIALLIISFVPAFFLSAYQYPDSNMNWEFISWSASGDIAMTNYNQQLKVANFLNANTPKGNEILVWSNWGAATIYWLSGHNFTSEYVSVRNPVNENIPSEEYQRIVNMVNDGDFDYIVLFWPNLTGLQGVNDSIVDITLNKYSYVESIDGANIFSKYNTQGEWAFYSFVQQFSNATLEYDLQSGGKGSTEQTFGNESIFMPYVASLTVNNETQVSIFQQPLPGNGSFIPNSYISYSNVNIPQNSTLKFSIAIDPSVWETSNEEGVQFEIFIIDNQSSNLIFSKLINPRENIEDRNWLNYEINLNQYAGQNVTICFADNSGPNGNAYHDWAYWGNPVILQGR
ncbi:MAG TPA: glycosyltransferase family 39 protein [Candidatus Bathyarchaeia archaeon]|nr:glycosyltransferase family 39 protein [Candidatus Bathyarchaeia archaeon]